ncbi:MAG: ATP-binding protein [Actinomycetota bacterium]
MTSLITGILEYARGSQDLLDAERLEVSRLVDAAALGHSQSLGELGGTLHVDAPHAIRADPDLLVVVCSNLIENSIKYRRPDVPPRIAVTSERTDGATVVRFSDNGIGIDPEFHEAVFSMFRRLHRHDVIRGNGIGLGFCRRIIERHGGTIALDSTPGEGTVVTFSIPDVASPASLPG